MQTVSHNEEESEDEEAGLLGVESHSNSEPNGGARRPSSSSSSRRQKISSSSRGSRSWCSNCSGCLKILCIITFTGACFVVIFMARATFKVPTKSSLMAGSFAAETKKEQQNGMVDMEKLIEMNTTRNPTPESFSQQIKSPSQAPQIASQPQSQGEMIHSDPVSTSRQILLVFNGEYAEEAQNLLESMHVNIPHLVKDVIVCVSDDKAENFAKDNSLRSFTLPNITESGIFPSLAFNIFTKRKMEAVLYLLERGMKVLYTDTNVVFLKDPTIFSPDQSKGYSTLFQIDGAAPLEPLCTGFFFADPTKDAISLLNATIEEMGRSNFTLDDQHAMETLPAEMLKKVQHLDLCQFPNGIRYFNNDVPRCKHEDAFIVHNNWVFHPQKKDRLINNHLWFIKAPTRLPTQPTQPLSQLPIGLRRYKQFKECLEMDGPLLTLPDEPLPFDVLSKHYSEMLALSASTRRLSPHNYVGYYGPWIENSFINTFSVLPFEKFYPLVPIFMQTTDIQVTHQEVIPKAREVFKHLREDVLYLMVVQDDEAFFHGLLNWTDAGMTRNIIVMSAGGWGNIALPLLIRENPPTNYPLTKKTLFSFSGTRRYHKVREKADSLGNMFGGSQYSYYMGDGWKEISQESVISLSPRGWGRNSFRTTELIQMGLPPLVLYDKIPWLPYVDPRHPNGGRTRVWGSGGLGLYCDTGGFLTINDCMCDLMKSPSIDIADTAFSCGLDKILQNFSNAAVINITQLYPYFEVWRYAHPGWTAEYTLTALQHGPGQLIDPKGGILSNSDIIDASITYQYIPESNNNSIIPPTGYYNDTCVSARVGLKSPFYIHNNSIVANMHRRALELAKSHFTANGVMERIKEFIEHPWDSDLVCINRPATVNLDELLS